MSRNTTTETIRVKSSVKDMLDKCKEEYLIHYPEMRETQISYNKIIHEMGECFLYVAQTTGFRKK